MPFKILAHLEVEVENHIAMSQVARFFPHLVHDLVSSTAGFAGDGSYNITGLAGSSSHRIFEVIFEIIFDTPLLAYNRRVCAIGALIESVETPKKEFDVGGCTSAMLIEAMKRCSDVDRDGNAWTFRKFVGQRFVDRAFSSFSFAGRIFSNEEQVISVSPLLLGILERRIVCKFDVEGSQVVGLGLEQSRLSRISSWISRT